MSTWFESSTTDETVSLSQKAWGTTETQLSTGEIVTHNRNFEISSQGELVRKDVFWADEIKNHRNNPDIRLKIAMKNLPLPAAFREAAIALRAKIRSKRKTKINFDSELEMLYLLAAIESFSIPYSKNLKTPGFNVLQFTPAEVIKNLPFSYDNLGFEKLNLLNKTDKKLLLACWGKPRKHSTLHKRHYDVWLKFEQLYSEHMENSRKLLFEEIENGDITTTQPNSYKTVNVERKEKSMTVAYLLLLFLGGFGAHHFYFGHVGTAICMLVLVTISVATPVFFAVVVSWCIIDAFLIPKWVNKHNEEIMKLRGLR